MGGGHWNEGDGSGVFVSFVSLILYVRKRCIVSFEGCKEYWSI